MNQEFIIGNFKLIQDEDGYAIMRKVSEAISEPIATFKYPEDAVAYFSSVILQTASQPQEQHQHIETRLIPLDIDPTSEEL